MIFEVELLDLKATHARFSRRRLRRLLLRRPPRKKEVQQRWAEEKSANSSLICPAGAEYNRGKPGFEDCRSMPPTRMEQTSRSLSSATAALAELARRETRIPTPSELQLAPIRSAVHICFPITRPGSPKDGNADMRELSILIRPPGVCSGSDAWWDRPPQSSCADEFAPGEAQT